MEFLDLINVQKSYGNTLAVNNLSISVKEGQFISLLGPSGCGKTTTLRMIAGFDDPDSGEILLEGQDLVSIPPNKRNAGMVFQSYALFPNLTVHGNIAFGLEVAHRPRKEIRTMVAELLSLVRLEGIESRYPHQLSGGQQQRVALARALALKPRLLLLDEPLSALDAKVRVSLRAEIRRIQSELGLTTIYVTHDQEEALSISDRVVVMREGGIEQDASPKEIYRQPASRFVADFIGTANQFDGTAIDSGTVQTKSFVLKAHIPEALLMKDIVVLVRPENIRLVENPDLTSSTENTITGRIESISFMGPITRVVVAANGKQLMCDVSATQQSRLEFNQEISLAFSPEVCQVMQA